MINLKIKPKNDNKNSYWSHFKAFLFYTMKRHGWISKLTFSSSELL